jgi:hypothetical protein
MDKEIDIYEFEWWNVFIGFSILLLTSIISIGIFISTILMLNKLGMSSANDYNFLLIIRASATLIFGIISFFTSFFGLLSIRSVPKLIVFRENNISIFPALGHSRDYSYDEISRIVISKRLPFKVRIYFSNNRIKVKFNPDRVYNYQILQETFIKKGLGHIIDRK